MPTSFNSQSTLEFDLRMQEYIEMVRQRRLPEAISYSKKYLVPFADTQLPLIQKAMALLAFPADTDCRPYQVPVDGRARWQKRTAYMCP